MNSIITMSYLSVLLIIVVPMILFRFDKNRFLSTGHNIVESMLSASLFVGYANNSFGLAVISFIGMIAYDLFALDLGMSTVRSLIRVRIAVFLAVMLPFVVITVLT